VTPPVQDRRQCFFIAAGLPSGGPQPIEPIPTNGNSLIAFVLRNRYFGSCRSALVRSEGRKARGLVMRYMLAWFLGVPGIVIVAWYFLAHS
jgi:hypothetical protein